MAYQNNYSNQRPNSSRNQQSGYQEPTAQLNKIDGTKEYDPVDEGQRLVNLLKEDKGGNGRRIDFTTSQLRKILSSATVVKNHIDREANNNEVLSPAIQEEIQYLRLRLVYQMGREPGLKKSLSEFNVDLPSVVKNIGNDRKKFNNFYRLLESIVAYRKFEGE